MFNYKKKKIFYNNFKKKNFFYNNFTIEIFVCCLHPKINVKNKQTPKTL